MERSPCSQQATCRLAETKRGCYEDVHHHYFYRRDYDSGISKEFRELDENKTLMCRAEHQEIHATTPPPERPSPAEMRAAIGRASLGEVA
jgi:hypothetical protein